MFAVPGQHSASIPLEYKVFQLWGIPVFIHAFLVLYFLYELTQRLQGVKKTSEGLPDYSQAGFAFLAVSLGFVVLFATVLVHELGHCAGAKVVGGSAQRILLWPLGGLALCQAAGGARGDLLVALAGPATHIPQYFAWRALHRSALDAAADSMIHKSIFAPLCASAMQLQITLAVFNLLVPVHPLDCSRVITSLLRLCSVPSPMDSKIMLSLSIITIALLAASMFNALHVWWLPFGYHPMNLVLLVWLGIQTYQLFNTICEHPSDNNRQPLIRRQTRNESDC